MGIEPMTSCMRNRRSATELIPQNITNHLAPLGFDPRTFGLWAQHASSAPRSSSFDDFRAKIENIILQTLLLKNATKNNHSL